MKLIENIPNSTYAATVSSFIIYAAKMTINNWGLTELERLRLNNFKKFLILVTKYSFVSMIFAVIVLFILAKSDTKSATVILLTTIFCFVAFLITMLIAERVFKFISSVLSFKYDYYAIDESENLLYRIVKLSSNNKFQIESKGIEGFIEVDELNNNR